MKGNLTTFQIILLVVTVFLIISGVLVFALKKSGGGSTAVQVDVWGTLSSKLISDYQNQINDLQENSVRIKYREFSEDNFEAELISELASGNGPDMVIFPDDMLVKHESKLFTIPYDSYPQSEFKRNFVDGADVLLKNRGISGIPLAVDPLVLYWNKTVLNSNGISQPPQYWDEFLDLNSNLTRTDESDNINKATIALGEFNNIENASDILTTLILQAGNPIIVRNEQGDFQSIFNNQLNYSIPPADAAINFFTQFSNPAKRSYTWNRSLPDSDEMFLSGDLAFYIGFASERDNLIQRNPNLNFGVSKMPQSRTSVENNRQYTGGKMYFVSVLNSSGKISGAFNTLSKMTNQQNMEIFFEMSDLLPVHRNMLSSVPSSDYLDVFNKSVLIMRPFLEPDPVKADSILSEAVSNVKSGRMTVSETLREVDQEFDLLIEER